MSEAAGLRLRLKPGSCSTAAHAAVGASTLVP